MSTGWGGGVGLGHCGPFDEGVGRASGRAIRTSLIVIVVEDMILTLLMWGFDSGVRISG